MSILSLQDFIHDHSRIIIRHETEASRNFAIDKLIANHYPTISTKCRKWLETSRLQEQTT
jgi:hypothetical protein